MDRYWIIRTLIVAYWIGSGIQCIHCGPRGGHGVVDDEQCTIAYKETKNDSVTAFITGFVTVDIDGNPTGFIDLKNDTIIGGSARGIPLRAGERVHIRHHAVKVEIDEYYDGKPYCYSALFGANTGATKLASVRLQQSPPKLIFNEGWVFMSGDWPLAEARLVAAISDGTNLILHSTPGDGTKKDTDRVYLLTTASPVHLDKTRNSETKPIESEKPYCKVVKDQPDFDCGAINTSDPQYQHVKAMASMATMW